MCTHIRILIPRQIIATVGSTLGLLAFVLAFTFGMAASRFDVRGELRISEAIAIRTADLRAQHLPEPQRSEIRALLDLQTRLHRP